MNRKMLRTRKNSNILPFDSRKGKRRDTGSMFPIPCRRLVIIIFIIIGLFMFFNSGYDKEHGGSSSKKSSGDAPVHSGRSNKQIHYESSSNPSVVKDKSTSGKINGKNNKDDDQEEGVPHVNSNPPKNAIGDDDEDAFTNGRRSTRYDKIAIALKTGKDVARKRVPIQLASFLQDVKNIMVIAEAPNVTVGNFEVIDVYTPAKQMYDDAAGVTSSKTSKRAIPLDDIDKNKSDFDQQSLLDNFVKEEHKFNVNDENVHRVQLEKRKEDALVPDNDSQGWKLDAHKNLPAFKIMYKKFPDVDWYLMIDDDTFVFLDNFLEKMKRYDPEGLHYLGQPNYFVGCDGVKNFGEGPNFAHGGTGIVISKGAMQKMMTVIDKCIVKYKDCWAGDVRVALCMRDADIFVRSPGDFHGDPPNVHFGWPNNPCSRPVTFHHLLIDQTQELFDVVRSTPFVKKSNYGQVFQKFYPKEGVEYIRGVDLPGSDIDHMQVPDEKSCRDQCNQVRHCSSWTFILDDKSCWIKKGIPKRKEASNAISGIFTERYKCDRP